MQVCKFVLYFGKLRGSTVPQYCMDNCRLHPCLVFDFLVSSSLYPLFYVNFFFILFFPFPVLSVQLSVISVNVG